MKIECGKKRLLRIAIYVKKKKILSDNLHLWWRFTMGWQKRKNKESKKLGTENVAFL